MSERVLFDDLVDARAAFLLGEDRGELQWADIWPVAGGSPPPRAIALTIEREDETPLRQLFWIGAVAVAGPETGA